MNYYYLLDIDAKDCNAHQALGIVSPLPVMASLLFTHALESRIFPFENIFKGVGIIYYNSTIRTAISRNQRRFVYRRGASPVGIPADKKKPPVSNSTIPAARCDLSIGLLLQSQFKLTPSDIEKEASLMRLAGGAISATNVTLLGENLEDAVGRLTRGRWVTDCTTEIMSSNDAGYERVKALVHAEKNDLWDKKGQVIPANLGYHFLRKPSASRATRNHPKTFEPLDAAWVEPIIGAVRLKSVFQFREKEDEKNQTLSTLPALWRYGWHKDCFLVTDNHKMIELGNYAINS